MSVERSINNPLIESDLAEINAGIKNADDLLKALNKAKAAGVDIGDQYAEVSQKRQKLIALKTTYFPGR